MWKSPHRARRTKNSPRGLADDQAELEEEDAEELTRSSTSEELATSSLDLKLSPEEEDVKALAQSSTDEELATNSLKLKLSSMKMMSERSQSTTNEEFAKNSMELQMSLKEKMPKSSHETRRMKSMLRTRWSPS